jgi:hypothetical protein
MIEYTSPKTTHLWSNERAPYVFFRMPQLYMPPASAHNYLCLYILYICVYIYIYIYIYTNMLGEQPRRIGKARQTGIPKVLDRISHRTTNEISAFTSMDTRLDLSVISRTL